MTHGPIVVVTGAPGAGKSSVARALAQTSACANAVYLHSDDFYANVVKGFIPPWLADAQQQNSVIIGAVVEAARAYARGGFEVVVDGVFGPWFLEPWRALVRDGYVVHYVVLRPNMATTLARGTARQASNALTDPAVIAEMCRQFSELGALEPHALDTSTLTVEQTVTRVRRTIGEASHLLAAE